MNSSRSLCVLVDQWSAYALESDPTKPLAVVSHERILSVNPLARAGGVNPGMKRRDAQAVCPSVVLVREDSEETSRAFEKVLLLIEEFVPRVEVVEAGTCLFPTLGPARYHGGERSLATVITERLRSLLWVPDRHRPLIAVAIADGPRTSIIAAAESIRRDLARKGPGSSEAEALIIPDGMDAKFLEPLSIRHMEPLVGAEMTDLFRRLGLRNIGRFAHLEPRDVLARFGSQALDAHRLARGRDTHTSNLTRPDVGVRVNRTMEPPLERVDQIAFAARAMAEDLHEMLDQRGLTAGKVLVVAETEAGDRLERLWHTERIFSATTVTQRVRWQLEGWISEGRGASRSHGAVTFLQIEPVDLVPNKGEQPGFWGGLDKRDELVMKGVARIQGLFGIDSVKVPRVGGGRSPVDAFSLIGIDTDTPDDQGHERPWPGSLPAPSPSRVWRDLMPVSVLDSEGSQVRVNGRGVMSAPPSVVLCDSGSTMRVQAWSGPWCIDERWWDPERHRRKARVQVLVKQSETSAHPSSLSAHLLTLEAGRWWVEATYD